MSVSLLMTRLFIGVSVVGAALALGVLPVRAQNAPLVEVPLVGQSINYYAVLLPSDYYALPEQQAAAFGDSIVVQHICELKSAVVGDVCSIALADICR